MKPTDPFLKLVDYTYAETCNGEIRIHQDLYKYSKELFEHAVAHELGHQCRTILQDILWDLQDLGNIRIHLKAMGFYFKHPKLIIRMLSAVHFNKKAKQIEVNWVLVFIYLLYTFFGWYIFRLF